MQVPDLVYAFANPKDVSGRQLEFFNVTEQRSGGLIQDVFEIGPFDKDKIVVVSNSSVRAIPGATQAVEEIVVQAVTHTGVIFDLHGTAFPATADLTVRDEWQGNVWVGGGGQETVSLRLFALYDAVANANLTRISISGFVIPRGNAGAF